MNLLRLWIKELFSSLSFIISESVLTVSIAVMTFCFVFSESMINGTDKIIGLVGGEYNLFTSNDNSNKVEEILKKYNVEYKKSYGDIAIIKNDKDTYTRYVKVVDKSYFTDDFIKNVSITPPIKNGIYLCADSPSSDKYAILFSSLKRAKMVQLGGVFKTGLAAFDNNTAFYVTDNLNDTQKNLPLCYEISSLNGNVIKAVSSVIETLMGVNVISKKDINEGFYSSLLPTRRTIDFIALLFVLLSSFYSISLMSSFGDYFALDIKLLYVNGYSKKQINLICIFSVFIMMLFFIILGFILGVLTTCLFAPIVSCIAEISGLDLSYYFLSFAVRIPFKPLLIRYSLILLSSFLISLPVFIKGKKSI